MSVSVQWYDEAETTLYTRVGPWCDWYESQQALEQTAAKVATAQSTVTLVLHFNCEKTSFLGMVEFLRQMLRLTLGRCEHMIVVTRSGFMQHYLMTLIQSLKRNSTLTLQLVATMQDAEALLLKGSRSAS